MDNFDEIFNLAKEKTWREVADEIGEHGREHWLRNKMNRHMTDEQKLELRTARSTNSVYKMRERQVERPDGTFANVVELNPERVIGFENKTPDDMLRLAGYDPTLFNLTKTYINSYDGKLSMRVVAEPTKDGLDYTKLSEIVAECVSQTSYSTETHVTDGVLPLFDMHFGFANVDDYFTMTGNVINQLRKNPVRELTIILGGDLLHHEGNGHTTSGTFVQPNYDTTQMVADFVAWLADFVDVIKPEVNSLRFIAVGGNHDRNITNAVLKAVQMTTHIEFIGLGHEELVGFEVGNLAMVAYHGAGTNKNRIKESDYLKVMSSDMPELLSKALLKHTQPIWWTGHLHGSMERLDGVEIKRVPAVHTRSQYELANGYVDGKHNKTNLYLFDSDTEVGRLLVMK